MSHFNFVKRGRPYSINSKCIFSWLCKINMKNLRTITLRMFLIPWIKWKYYIIWDINILHSIENTRRWRAICPIFCHYSFRKTWRGWKLRTRSKIAPSHYDMSLLISDYFCLNRTILSPKKVDIFDAAIPRHFHWCGNWVIAAILVCILTCVMCY